MSNHKRFLLLGSLLILVAGLFTFGPLGSPQAFAASMNGCPPTQKENSGSNNSSWVEVIQFTLNGYESFMNFPTNPFKFSGYPLSVDGSFGPATETALAAWEKYWGSTTHFDGTGTVGPNTWATFGYCVPSSANLINDHGGELESYGTCPPTLSSGSSGIWVYALQDMLNTDEHGNVPLFSHTSPVAFTVYLSSDGSFGSQTKNAVIDYQAHEGLPDDGTVGPQTWNTLGMCY